MKKILNSNILLIIPLLIIMIISFLNMQNAKHLSSLYNYHLIKQIIWYILGFIILILIKYININYILKYSFIYYLVSLLLLVIVLIYSKSTNGAKAWIDLGIISFQPSEFAKLSLILYLSKLTAEYEYKNIKQEIIFITKLVIITIIPSILVFLEPDTGAIIFFIISLITIMYNSNIKKIWLIIISLLIISFLGVFFYLYFFKQDILINILGTSFFYRMDRIINIKNNYQLENALISIGSTNLFGTGLNKVALYIPEAPTDFIFAFNISNFGIISGIIVIICYILIDIYLINRLNKINNKKIKLVLSSFISMFLFQEIINISMNIGIFPIIGIPLPFLSYGGSTIVIYFIFLGIIINYKNLKY